MSSHPSYARTNFVPVLARNDTCLTRFIGTFRIGNFFPWLLSGTKVCIFRNSGLVSCVKWSKAVLQGGVPLTVLGLGSIGALLVSDRGRRVLQLAIDRLSEAPDRLLEWNDAAQAELERIQKSLNQLSESLGATR
jgi:hypothetical protein